MSEYRQPVAPRESQVCERLSYGVGAAVAVAFMRLCLETSSQIVRRGGNHSIDSLRNGETRVLQLPDARSQQRSYAEPACRAVSFAMSCGVVQVPSSKVSPSNVCEVVGAGSHHVVHRGMDRRFRLWGNGSGPVGGRNRCR